MILLKVPNPNSGSVFYSKEPEYQRSRFKSMKCISNNKTLLSFRYCRVKVSRNSSGLAINMTLHKKMVAPLLIRLTISYKYGTIYREVIKVPEFELCRALENFNLMHPYLKALIKIFGNSVTPFIKGCPYQGDVDFVATADLSKFPSITPSGLYKTNCFIDTPHTKVLLVTSEVEVVSNIRTSF